MQANQVTLLLVRVSRMANPVRRPGVTLAVLPTWSWWAIAALTVILAAGAGYYAGWAYRGQQVQVALVGDSVQVAVAGRVIKVHPIRHDRTKEHGAFATPTGGNDAAALLSPSTRSHPSPGYRSQPG